MPDKEFYDLGEIDLNKGPEHYIKPISLVIPSAMLQEVVQRFTLSDRFWTAYPADKVEHMLRYYHVIPHEVYYKEYNPDTEEAIFSVPPLTKAWQEFKKQQSEFPALGKIILKQLNDGS